MAEKDKEPEPERELTELEGLALKINEKSDETLESTRRMREMCAEAKDAGMKTLIALDDQEELIDKFEEAADGINHDMALAEKALKVGGKTFEVADFKTISAAHFCFFSLQHDLPSNQETVDSC